MPDRDLRISTAHFNCPSAAGRQVQSPQSLYEICPRVRPTFCSRLPAATQQTIPLLLQGFTHAAQQPALRHACRPCRKEKEGRRICP